MAQLTQLYGDCRDVLPTLPAESVHLIITSPPYFGLRAYSDDPREIGREPTPEAYIANLVAVFREARRVLRGDGVLVLNLGDSYAGSWGNYAPNGIKGTQRPKNEGGERWERPAYGDTTTLPATAYAGKPKDKLLIPHRVALALQADGWYVRSDLPWLKRNAMPESVTDRPSVAHEYVFILAKSERYWWDAEAIRVATISEAPAGNKQAMNRGRLGREGWSFDPARSIPESGRNYRTTDPWFASLDAEIAATRARLAELERIRERGGLLTDDEGEALALPVNPRPYSGARQAADYVGPDGKPYIASPDCPLHSHLARSRTWHTGQRDGPEGDQESHTTDSGSDPVAAPEGELYANSARDSSDLSPSTPDSPDPQNASSHTAGSNDASRRRASPSFGSTPFAGGSSSSRSGRRRSTPASPDHMTGSPSPDYSETATPHSTENRRTGDLSTLHGTPSVQSASHTPYSEPLPLFAGLNLDMPESRTSEDSGEGEPRTDRGETPDHTAGNETAYDTSASGVDTRCTCIISQVDHFAVFPPSLVEPFMLAACPRQACPACGAGWVRVVERDVERNWKECPKDEARRDQGLQSSVSGLHSQYHKVTKIDRGFRPACACPEQEPVPGVALDPFAGSGTVGQVAIAHGRRAILIELNEVYAALQDGRTDGVQVSLFDGEAA